MTREQELEAALSEARSRANSYKVALDLVSGALCDAATIPVPNDEIAYGAAVRLLTAQRDTAETAYSTAVGAVPMVLRLVEMYRAAESTVAALREALRELVDTGPSPIWTRGSYEDARARACAVLASSASPSPAPEDDHA